MKISLVCRLPLVLAAASVVPATHAAGTFTRIVDASMMAPGQSSNFYSFGFPAISNGNVVFSANYASGSGLGIYTGIAGATGAARIADLTTPAPSQGGSFSDFGRRPAISGGNVVFYGYYQINNRGYAGVYTGTAGNDGINRLADNNTAVPGQNGAFSSAGPASVSGNNVAFLGLYNSNNASGVYTETVGGVAANRLADTSMIAPGQTTNFYSFIAPAVSGGNVAFFATYDSGAGSGIYSGTVGSPGARRIADKSTSVPGQAATFTGFGNPPAVSGGSVAFQGNYYTADNRSGQGIYTAALDGSGIRRIADFSTVAPGQTATFSSFGLPVISGRNVAFSAFYDARNGQGVYRGTIEEPGVVRLADLTTTVPGRTDHFTGFHDPVVSGNNVVFYGSFFGGYGLYLSLDGTLTPVIAIGDALFGGLVTSLSLGDAGLDGNQLAFNYSTSNGREGIAVFTFADVPEPSTWMYLSLGVGSLGLSLRQRSNRFT